MNACTDALFTVLKGHFVAYTCKLLGISDPNDTPKTLPPLNSKEDKQKLIAYLSREIVNELTLNSNALLNENVSELHDDVYSYAKVFCHYAALALEFKDAWAEGDGNRVIRCWKIFMLHFRCSGRIKYAWQALRLQFQLVSLPPSLALQLKWERFVNTHGGLGTNIPCDLFNEHLKLFKEIIHSMGSNLTETSIKRAVRSVTTLQHVQEKFDIETNVPMITTAHSTRADEEDVHRVASVLQPKKYCYILLVENSYNNYHKFSSNSLNSLNWKQIQTWITKKKKDMLDIVGENAGEEILSDTDATDCSDEESDDNLYMT